MGKKEGGGGRERERERERGRGGESVTLQVLSTLWVVWEEAVRSQDLTADTLSSHPLSQ